MKTSSINPLGKTSYPIFTSAFERYSLPEFEWAAGSRGSAQPCHLLLTTSHPESADEWAGEVVQVPVEFAEGAVLLDLNEVTRIDSCGIALFLEVMQRITVRGGCLILIRIHAEVRRLLEMTKLNYVFHIASTREHALAELGQLLAA